MKLGYLLAAIMLIFIGGSIDYGLKLAIASDKYIDDVSKRTISIICKDKKFLNYSNLNNIECEVLLPTLAKRCNEHVKILIPEPSDNENVDAINVKKSGKIGVLYSMCLKVLAYERKSTKRIKPGGGKIKGSEHLK